jgi:uncharacterized membrane protein
MKFVSTLHRWVYCVLLVGLVLSVGLLLSGVAVSLLSVAALPEHTLAPVPALRSALAGEAQGLLSLGLLGLMATPLFAVITSIIVSASKHDRIGILAGIGVALVMVVSFLLGES